MKRNMFSSMKKIVAKCIKNDMDVSPKVIMMV